MFVDVVDVRQEEYRSQNYFIYTNDLPITQKEIGSSTMKDPVLSRVLFSHDVEMNNKSIYI